MWLDFYSGTFFALMDKYKKKYKLLIEDQAEYYFESLFLLFVQTFFCIAVIYNIEVGTIFKYELDPTLNICLYFTSLILHFSTIYSIRNGIVMMKYVVYHSEEFQRPSAAFLLGLMTLLTNCFCGVTNLIYSLTLNDVNTVIAKFVAFKILVQLQDYYLRQRSSFEIRQAVLQNPLIIKADQRKVYGSLQKDKSVSDEKSLNLIEND